MKIIQADELYLEPLAELFDQYRQFYGQPSSLPEVKHFLFYRLMNHDSVIFLALAEQNGQETPVGFLQLYPSFSSIALQSIWILNDLYVHPSVRQQGIARALMNEARDLAKARGDRGLMLSTAKTNQPAQALYRSLGYRKDETFEYYFLEV